MVVPYADVTTRGEERLELGVRAVVAPMRPEAREVGRLRLAARDLGVAVATGREAHVVGVDHVAEPDEDVRLPGVDRRRDRDAVDRVAADALARHVATEGETDRLRVIRRGRRPEGTVELGPSATARRPGADPCPVAIRRVGLETGQRGLSGEIVTGGQVDRRNGPVGAAGESHVEGPWPAPSCPELGRFRPDVADDDTVGDRRPGRCCRVRGHGESHPQARHQQDGMDSAHDLGPHRSASSLCPRARVPIRSRPA